MYTDTILVHIHWASHARNQWLHTRLHIYLQQCGIHMYTVFFHHIVKASDKNYHNTVKKILYKMLSVCASLGSKQMNFKPVPTVPRTLHRTAAAGFCSCWSGRSLDCSARPSRSSWGIRSLAVLPPLHNRKIICWFFFVCFSYDTIFLYFYNCIGKLSYNTACGFHLLKIGTVSNPLNHLPFSPHFFR